MFRLVTVLLFASSSLVTAQTGGVNPKEEKLSDAERAKEILAWSMETVKNLPSYSATQINEMPNGGMIRTQISFKNQPDGTIWLRTEAKAESSLPIPPVIIIQNAEGMWQLVGSKAIKMEFMTEQQKKCTTIAMEMMDPSKLVAPELKLEEKEVQKIPCWAITMKNSGGNLSEMESVLKQMPGMEGEKLKEMLPAITVQYIGKANGFPYGMESFNSAGVKINSQIYSEVNLEPNLENAYFQIPADYEVIVATSPQDMSKVMVDAMVGGKKKTENEDKKP